MTADAPTGGQGPRRPRPRGPHVPPPLLGPAPVAAPVPGGG